MWERVFSFNYKFILTRVDDMVVVSGVVLVSDVDVMVVVLGAVLVSDVVVDSVVCKRKRTFGYFFLNKIKRKYGYFSFIKFELICKNNHIFFFYITVTDICINRYNSTQFYQPFNK